MRLLRMKEEYIEFIRRGRKSATTRTVPKGMGRYELAFGPRFGPEKSGVVIEITSLWGWTRRSLAQLPGARQAILSAEDSRRGAPFDTWQNFIALLERLNGCGIGMDRMMYTHFFRRVI